MRPKRDLVRENSSGAKQKWPTQMNRSSDEDPPSFDKEPPILSCLWRFTCPREWMVCDPYGSDSFGCSPALQGNSSSADFRILRCKKWKVCVQGDSL